MPTKTRRKLTGAAFGIAATCAALPALAATTVVSGNVSGWVASAVMTGTAADTRSVNIAVHMTLKNAADLARFVTAVSTPGSASYGQYLTPAAFAARYAPDTADVAAVQAMLTGAGMTNVTVGPHGTYVAATATVAQLSRTFAVTQNL